MRIHMKLQNCIINNFHIWAVYKLLTKQVSIYKITTAQALTLQTQNIKIIKSKKAKHDWKGKNSEIHFVYEYYKLFVSRLADRSAAERGGGDTDTAPVRWSRQVKEPPVLHLHFTFILNILTVRRGDMAT